MTKLTIDLNDYSQIERETIENILKLCDHDKDVSKTQKEYPIWKPKEQEYFWFIDPDGGISKERKVSEEPWVSSLFNRGNVFKTKEAAQRMADRVERMGIFENKMMEFSAIDGVDKYCYLYYDRGGCNPKGWVYGICYHVRLSPLEIYMTEEQAKKAVDWANLHFPGGL